MLKILKNNLKKSWWAIIIIFVLLCAQAMADLNLPDFTSKIVNIGIQQKGIENSSPEVITKSTMDKVLLLSKEDNFILNNYQVFSKDNISEKEYSKYLKQYPNIEKQNSYIKKNINEETENKLDLEIGKSLMLVNMLESKETLAQLKNQMSTYMNNDKFKQLITSDNNNGEYNYLVNNINNIDFDTNSIIKSMSLISSCIIRLAFVI